MTSTKEVNNSFTSLHRRNTVIFEMHNEVQKSMKTLGTVRVFSILHFSIFALFFLSGKYSVLTNQSQNPQLFQ